MSDFYGNELLKKKTYNFLRAKKLPFVIYNKPHQPHLNYINEVISGKPLRMGTGFLENNHVIKGLDLSALSPDLQGRERAWRVN